MMDIIGDKLADVFNPLFSVIYAWIVKPFLELKLFKTLIYGSSDDENLVFNTFTPDEIEKIVKPGMDVIMILAVFLLLIAIVMAGMKISSVAINPANRTYIIEFFKDFAIVAILLLNLPTLYSLIFGVNDAIISVFSVAHEDALMEMKETIEPGDDVLGQMIIQLCLLGLFIWGNFYYMMRKLTLVLFMILGPLMAVMLLIPQTKGITIGWLKEFIGTVFVQSVHACLYWVIALMSITESGLEAVILYIIFIPTAEALRSLLGMGGQMSNGLSKAGAMFGMSALAGMYGSVKGAIGDKSVAGALRGAANGIKDSSGRNSGSDSDENTENNVKSTLGGNTGTDTGTNSLAERMLKPGDVTSKMGKMALGMAGSIAGSPMGPAGAIAGSTVGFGVGGVVGGVAGRVGGAGVEGVKLGAKQLAKGAKSGWQNAKDSYNADSLADEKLANELADGDTTSWASNNKEQFMEQMKEKFPDAHEDSLEGMWNSKVNDKKSDFLKQARQTVGDIKKNDGAFGKAQQVADKATGRLTDAWADNNKEHFMNEYDKNNPITEENDLATHNMNKQASWNNTLDKKRKEISDLSNDTAKSMSNGLPENHAYINKDDFANMVGAKMLNNEKSAFKEQYREQYNPDASDNEIDSQFDQKHGGQREAYVLAAMGAVKGNKPVKASDLVNESTENMTQQWASENKEQFVSAYQHNNPSASPQEVSEAWEKELSSQKSVFSDMSNKAAKSITNGNDLSQEIDPNQYAENVGNELYNNDKAMHVFSVPPMSKTQKEKLFDEEHGDKRQQYIQSAKQSVGTDSEVQNAQSLATASADNITKQWADQNKSQFITTYKQSNPGISEEEVETAWGNAVKTKRKELGSMANSVASKMTNGQELSSTDINSEQFASNLGKQMYDNEQTNYISSNNGATQKDFDDQFGHKKQDYIQSAKKSIPSKSDNQNAQSLATTSADHMTKEWSANNKGQFVTSHKQSNPGKSEKEVEIAWDNASKEKRKEFVSMANSVASKMTNGKDMSSTKISSDQFATNLGQKMYDNEKANYVASAPGKLSNGQIELEFDKQNGSKKVAYIQSAEKAVGKFTKVNASQLANDTAENMTIDWAKKNQSDFSKNYKLQNPGASPSEVDVAWTKQVDSKRKEMITVTTGLAQKMSNGQSIQNTQLDSKAFAGNLGKELYDNEKVNYRANYKQQASASDQQLEVEFEKGQAGTGRAYFKAARNAVKDVNGAQIYDKSDLSHEVNTPYLVSQLATKATNQEKQKYITEQISNNVPENVAEDNWQTQEAAPTYQRNLKSVSSQLPKRIPLDKRINDGAVKKMVGAGYNGGAHAISSTLELPKITNFVKDTKLGKLAVAGTQGANAGYQNALFNPPNGIVSKAINPIVGGTSGAISAMKTSFQEKHVPENAVEKQAGFRNAAAYATGIVGGVRGYKKASNLASKHNPYNRPVNDQIAEVSDIKHLAQQVDDGNGNMEIAKGSVQMVTTNDKSFIQVRDRTGQTRVISRHGSGDSALKKGDTVYQDLTVKDDTLLQDSNPYRYDSAGGKSELNRRINVSPNNLLANRNTRKNPRVVQEVQAYNQQVDSGQFYSNDVQSQMKDLKMIVTKERSYMEGTDSQGQNHRVSPYGAGDARLNPNEARKVNYSVRNRRFNQEDALDEADESINYTTTLTPDDLIPVKSNKRASRRNDFEAVRHKSLGGTF